jgi:hypothetical protein
MDIGSFLLEVATTYDRAAGVSTPTQRLLKQARRELQQHVPGGIEVKGSGGQTTATFTPWLDSSTQTRRPRHSPASMSSTSSLRTCRVLC